MDRKTVVKECLPYLMLAIAQVLAYYSERVIFTRRKTMYKIMKAEKLADKIFLMDVHAPRVAKHCQPGQFIIVKMDEKGERIPLTICDYDREAGTITIVVQEVGASTTKMGELKEGDYFRDFTGPLGCASEFVHEDLETLKSKKMLFVAGGLGAAPVYRASKDIN